MILGLFLCCWGCSSGPSSHTASPGRSDVVGRFDGGEVTKEEVTHELNRLPPMLKERFEGSDGRRELAQSVLDKRLMLAEARRRHLQDDPHLREQVEELEDRLLLQALLATEEKSAGPASEEEQRRWYEANQKTLRQPERVRVVRLLANVAANAPKATRLAAKQRAEGFLQRLRQGQPLEKLATLTDGPEKTRGGDLGFVAPGDLHDPAFERAAFGLKKAGDLSSVVEGVGGFAVFKLVERHEARLPPFEEIRSEVEARMQPELKRKVFNQLVTRLRKESSATVEMAAAR